MPCDYVVLVVGYGSFVDTACYYGCDTDTNGHSYDYKDIAMINDADILQGELEAQTTELNKLKIKSQDLNNLVQWLRQQLKIASVYDFDVSMDDKQYGRLRMLEDIEDELCRRGL